MRLNRFAHLAAAATLVLAAACGDAPVGPDIIATDAPALSKHSTDEITTVQFTLDPRTGGQFAVQDNIVWFPANAVCDPATSSYGPSEWDLPCTPLATPITFTAHATDMGHGHWRVDISPEVRFAPSDDPNRWVYLYMKDGSAGAKAYQFPPILWLAPDGSWIDESLTDATLVTKWWDKKHIYRRIKHFSGYNVSSGFADLGTIDIGLSLSRANRARNTAPAVEMTDDATASDNGSASENGVEGENGDGNTAGRSGHLMSSGRKK